MEKENNTFETFEFVLGGKTYVSRKMNPELRGLCFKKYKLSEVQNLDKLIRMDELDEEEQQDCLRDMGAVFEITPNIMWQFIKPEDKRYIGTYDGDFLDMLADNEAQVLFFVQWVFSRLGKITSFLANGSERAKASQSI